MLGGVRGVLRSIMSGAIYSIKRIYLIEYFLSSSFLTYSLGVFSMIPFIN